MFLSGTFFSCFVQGDPNRGTPNGLGVCGSWTVTRAVAPVHSIEAAQLMQPVCYAGVNPQLQWCKIAEDIAESYKKWDGFVVLHGTDTMAYTSSALSFMLQNLGKSVRASRLL
jgi:hypothetical protein